MEREIFKAWVTKYALTEGIEFVEAELCANISETMISYGSNGYSAQHAHAKDWHRTPEAALARAEEMRKAKIYSVKKRLAKLENMKFEAPNKI